MRFFICVCLWNAVLVESSNKVKAQYREHHERTFLLQFDHFNFVRIWIRFAVFENFDKLKEKRLYLFNQSQFQRKIYSGPIAQNLSYFSNIYVPFEFSIEIKWQKKMYLKIIEITGSLINWRLSEHIVNLIIIEPIAHCC